MKFSRKALAGFVFLIALAFQGAAQAGEDSPEGFKDRKGFFLSIGPRIDYEFAELDKLFGGAQFRIGGGLSERVLLFYESNSGLTKKNSNYLSFSDSQAKVQAFVWKDLYANLGLGFAVGESIKGQSSDSTDVGFASSAGVGYEFRLKPKFYISPEVTYNYRRIEGDNYHGFGSAVNFGWYF